MTTKIRQQQSPARAQLASPLNNLFTLPAKEIKDSLLFTPQKTKILNINSSLRKVQLRKSVNKKTEQIKNNLFQS